MGKEDALIPVEDGKYDYAWVDRDDPRVREVRTIDVIDHVVSKLNLSGEPTDRHEVIPTDDNLLIIGDSGDALRSLGTVPEWRHKYYGLVKLVYIDPPFNTAQAFTHYADQLEHSIWLTMMRDRIRDIKPLMAPDASIWVHLDDVEVHRMRVMLDEEFGAGNFVSEVVWQKADSTRNDAQGLSVDHDTILVYRASPAWLPNRLARTAEFDARFSSPDGDERSWFDGDPTAPDSTAHQGMVYAIQHPITGNLHYPARGRHWWANQDEMLRQMQEYAPYELRDIVDDDKRAGLCGVAPSDVRSGVQAIMLSVPLAQSAQLAQQRLARGTWPLIVLRSGGTGGLGRKSYATSRGIVASTWWGNDIVGHNREAKAELKALFPGVVPFTTPKPERLLQRIIHIGSNPGDIVLDCFAGSGTTAAVAQKMGREWVTVELVESTVDTFTRPRLEKVVNGDDPGGVTATTERVAIDDLPEGMTAKQAQEFRSALSRVVLSVDGLDNRTVRMLRAATKTRDERTVRWYGGGGFTVARVGPSMYEVDDQSGVVLLSRAATNGAWNKQVAGQLGYELTPDDPVFCGIKGRQRLAVVDGIVSEQVVRAVVENLGEQQSAVIVGKGVLPEAADLLSQLSPVSAIRKAPRDLFPRKTVR